MLNTFVLAYTPTATLRRSACIVPRLCFRARLCICMCHTVLGWLVHCVACVFMQLLHLSSRFLGSLAGSTECIAGWNHLLHYPRHCVCCIGRLQIRSVLLSSHSVGRH